MTTKSPGEKIVKDIKRATRKHYSSDEKIRIVLDGLRCKGNCYDNGAVETFFKTIKAELIWRRSWPTRREAEAAIFQYINGFYNPRRRHSALGWKSPVAFEAQAA